MTADVMQSVKHLFGDVLEHLHVLLYQVGAGGGMHVADDLGVAQCRGPQGVKLQSVRGLRQGSAPAAARCCRRPSTSTLRA